MQMSDVDYLSAIPKAIRSTFVHKAAKFHAPIADNYDLKLSIFLLAISILLNSAALKIQKSSFLKMSFCWFMYSKLKFDNFGNFFKQSCPKGTCIMPETFLRMLILAIFLK